VDEEEEGGNLKFWSMMRQNVKQAVLNLRDQSKETKSGLAEGDRNASSSIRQTVLAPALIAEIIETVRPFTMVHESGVEFVITESVRLVDQGIPGAFVECGVWRGGCSIASLLAQRAAFGKVVRPIYLLDSFEGLPLVTDKDGPLAAEWQTGKNVQSFLENCKVAEEEVRAALTSHGFNSKEAIILKGWFKDILPGLAGDLDKPGIALLRLDGDWYDSTMDCLVALEPLVREEGTIIVDDYYAWDGCALAVHDYLSRSSLSYRIKSLPYNFGMYLTKRLHRRSYDEF
jgi:O-methyltransferase